MGMSDSEAQISRNKRSISDLDDEVKPFKEDLALNELSTEIEKIAEKYGLSTDFFIDEFFQKEKEDLDVTKAFEIVADHTFRIFELDNNNLTFQVIDSKEVHNEDNFVYSIRFMINGEMYSETVKFGRQEVMLADMDEVIEKFIEVLSEEIAIDLTEEVIKRSDIVNNSHFKNISRK